MDQKVIFILLICIFTLFGCNSDQGGLSHEEIINPDHTLVIYFHTSRKCETCNAIESETKKLLNEQYSEELVKGKLEFKMLNIEEKNVRQLARELGISGQAIILRTQDQQVDISSYAFMNASVNPDKYRGILKEEIDKLL